MPQGFVQQALAGKVPGQMYANPLARASYPSDAPPNVLQRFLDVVSDLVSMGFFVLLDNQLQQDKLARVRRCRNCLRPQHNCGHRGHKCNLNQSRKRVGKKPAEAQAHSYLWSSFLACSLPTLACPCYSLFGVLSDKWHQYVLLLCWFYCVYACIGDDDWGFRGNCMAKRCVFASSRALLLAGLYSTLRMCHLLSYV